ncbi:MAG: hypothetical protein JWM12_961, partial [Ilumatobacteraceae bacterium]|nr:hypothetical protein [Ilumatobacteraceae bacterium]
MNEFEERELRDQLGRMSGAFPDSNTAFAEVVGRVATARRRRAVVIASSTAAVVVAA